MNRFFTASVKLHEIASQLIDKGFEELDECVSPDELADRMLIDTEKRTFYFTDDQCIKEANEIIKEKYDCHTKLTNLNEVIKWT